MYSSSNELVEADFRGPAWNRTPIRRRTSDMDQVNSRSVWARTEWLRWGVSAFIALGSSSVSAQTLDTCPNEVIQQNAAGTRTVAEARACPRSDAPDLPTCFALERAFIASLSDASGNFTRLERNQQLLEGFFIERGNQVAAGLEIDILSDGSFDGFISVRNSDGSVSSLEFVARAGVTNSGLAAEAGQVILVFGGSNMVVANQFCLNPSPGVIPVADTPPPSGEPDPGNGCGDGIFAWDPSLGCDPIVFDFGERGFDLTGIEDGVRFDIDADGALEQVAWTAARSDDAFLALDRNGNGEIDDGSELFGNVTVLGDGSTAAHGYVALTELDVEANGGNANDYVDHRDRDFSKLLLWTDRDHDGEATRDELIGLRERGIFAIALDADESDVIDEHGNRLAFVSPAYAWRRFRVERIRTTDVFLPFRELAP